MSETGIIVDIQRFSIHDGPGIRTTVFLKGCPLNCKWCHNPEAINYNIQLSFNREKCLDCFKCISVCPSSVHFERAGKHEVNFSECNLSGRCLTVCPNKALTLTGKVRTVDKIIELILRDKDYYNNSGGGVTISGGEPMTQFQFTKQILKACKENEIHTTLDTCGHAPSDRYLDIMPYVDLFLYDFKESDFQKHKEYTGVYNDLIQKNFNLLYDNGAKIILRCPIVPGFNDTEKHFHAISDIYRKFTKLHGIEIMPYHNIGLDKARKIGAEQNFISVDTTDKVKSREWISALTKYGIKNIKLG
ncbi:MAG: glycyl-radical enzyme activating protein [Melioribacteraceae bacterium]|nr:glycyl-radical enzyme activating protein [Melioribacteraceae bacterium]